jgi:hypothetical protein
MRVLECKVVSKVESTGHASLRMSVVKWNSVACVAVTCNRCRWWRWFFSKKAFFYLLRV